MQEFSTSGKILTIHVKFNSTYSLLVFDRFWQYGEWVDVVVDDYLPSRDGQLIFMNSNSGGSQTFNVICIATSVLKAANDSYRFGVLDSPA